MATTTVEARPLNIIAREILKTWPNIAQGAKPYVSALLCLRTVNESYYQDDAKSLVLYFLSNASTWRGPDARRIKAELKAMVK